MKNIILNKVKELESDIITFDYEDSISLTIDDCEGFDEDWNVIDRQLDNPNGVDRLLEFLTNTCKSVVSDFYTTFHYDNFDVIVGYSSFDE